MLICSECGQGIASSDDTATAPNGVAHASCGKRGKAHGREISLRSLSAEIDKLKHRVQELERITELHDRSIDFRVGGAQ